MTGLRDAARASSLTICHVASTTLNCHVETGKEQVVATRRRCLQGRKADGLLSPLCDKHLTSIQTVIKKKE